VWPYFLAGDDIFAENARAKATRLKWNVAVLGHKNWWRREGLPKIMTTPNESSLPSPRCTTCPWLDKENTQPYTTITAAF